MPFTLPTGRRLVKPAQRFVGLSVQQHLPTKRLLQAFSSMTSSPDSFFRSISQRWLHDEDRNQALRYRPFNIDALKHEIIQRTGASSVVDMAKLGEGRCNRAFQVQLSDGRNVVARIPTPIAGPRHLVTASEVATMKFLRDRLGLTQVPQIISWSSRAEETPVGAEYIVMDLADGIQLAAVWPRMTMKQKIRLVLQWMKFERKVIHAFSKGGFGSLYLRKDLPTDSARDIYITGSDEPEADYVLGPSVFQRGYWEDQYGTPEDLNLDRGPWPDVASYLKSLSVCERAWISKYAQRPIGNRNYVAPWEVPARLQTPEEHLRMLDLYDRVAQYLVPTDYRLLRPTMTLIDSNTFNIFLSHDAFLRDGTIEISAVIDWQHTTILPLYNTAVMPNFITQAAPNEGQDEAEFAKEREYLRKSYHALYSETKIDVVWAEALCFDESPPTAKKMPIAAQSCWHLGYADLQLDILRVALKWEKLAPGTECPIASEGLTEQDLERATEDFDTWHRALLAREDIERSVGLSDNGSVHCKHYDSAVQINRELFRAWKADLDTRELCGVDPVDIWPVGQDTLRSERVSSL